MKFIVQEHTEIDENTCCVKLHSTIVSEQGFLLICTHVCCVLDLWLVICLSGQQVLAVTRSVRIATTVRQYMAFCKNRYNCPSIYGVQDYITFSIRAFIQVINILPEVICCCIYVLIQSSQSPTLMLTRVCVLTIDFLLPYLPYTDKRLT